jgi:hypothetical protein
MGVKPPGGEVRRGLMDGDAIVLELADVDTPSIPSEPKPRYVRKSRREVDMQRLSKIVND